MLSNLSRKVDVKSCWARSRFSRPKLIWLAWDVNAIIRLPLAPYTAETGIIMSSHSWPKLTVKLPELLCMWSCRVLQSLAPQHSFSLRLNVSTRCLEEKVAAKDLGGTAFDEDPTKSLVSEIISSLHLFRSWYILMLQKKHQDLGQLGNSQPHFDSHYLCGVH